MTHPAPPPPAPNVPPAAGPVGPKSGSGGLDPVLRAVLGLALLLPAALALLWSYVLPTLSTVRSSFRRESPLRDRPTESAGLENYRDVFDAGLVGHIGFALLLGLLPLVLALLAAPLLAVVAARAGRAARLVTRGVLALPLAGYAPVALLLGWRFDRIDPESFADHPRIHLVTASAAVTFGLVVAVAATAYLSALRDRAPAAVPAPSAGLPGGPGTVPGSSGPVLSGAGLASRLPLPALLTVAGFLILGVLAAALQIYSIPSLLTNGPQDATHTPLVDMVQASFQRYEFGTGAAVSTVLGLLLGLLGLGATGLLLATRARLEFDGWRDAPGASGGHRQAPVFLALAVLGLVVFLAVHGWAITPWLTDALSGDGTLLRSDDVSQAYVNTWLPPLPSALVGVVLAALAGFGIGALRPLGRWSELLLLPFAPWLFVGLGPLALANYQRAVESGQINTFLGLIPPSWLSVPALFAFTLLFRGQQRRWRAGGGFGRTLVLPALPMLGLAVLLSWLVHAQHQLWPLLVATELDHMPATIIAQRLAAAWLGTVDGALSPVLPLPVLLLFLLAFVALQIGYLDRLAIRVGRAADGTPEHH